MSGNQRVFGIEPDEHGTPQLSKAAAASDQAAHKRLIKKIRKALTKLGNEHVKSNITVVVESGYSGKILIAVARHCSNDPVFEDDLIASVVGAMKFKSRNANKPLSEFNHVPPARAGLEGTLAEAVRTGILGNVMRKTLLDLAERLVKDDEKEARESECTATVRRHSLPFFKPFN